MAAATKASTARALSSIVMEESESSPMNRGLWHRVELIRVDLI